jgi:WD40 repeat protein
MRKLEKLIHFGSHGRKVNCIACNEEWIVTGGTDTTTTIWESSNMESPFHSVTSCRDEVVSCALGDNFGMLVSAGRDGSILLILTSTGTTHHVIDISETPLLVLMTRGWGFVLVHSTMIVDAISHYFLTLFTLNGELIRKKEISFNIQAWATWESPQGFDYVAAVGINGELYVFEASFLEMSPFVPKLSGQVVTMKHFVKEELLFIVTETHLLVYSSAQLKLDRLQKFVFGKL